MNAPLLISMEGGEGAGKSTQAKILHERMESHGIKVEMVRDPGGTELGDYIRQYLLGKRPIGRIAEMLMFEASRAELVERSIRPFLANGVSVIIDRFIASTVAYQGHGRGMPLDLIDVLNDFATTGIVPDLTFLLDIDPRIGLERAMARHLLAGDVRFVQEDLEFHDRVRNGYLNAVPQHSSRWTVLDASHSLDDVSDAIWERVLPMLDRSG